MENHSKDKIKLKNKKLFFVAIWILFSFAAQNDLGDTAVWGQFSPNYINIIAGDFSPWHLPNYIEIAYPLLWLCATISYLFNSKYLSIFLSVIYLICQLVLITHIDELRVSLIFNLICLSSELIIISNIIKYQNKSRISL